MPQGCPIMPLASVWYIIDVGCDPYYVREVVPLKFSYNCNKLLKDMWYDCIILLHKHIYTQVINGIMERPDWATAITTPIGILPTGSGNALCASLLHEAGYVHVVTQ